MHLVSRVSSGLALATRLLQKVKRGLGDTVLGLFGVPENGSLLGCDLNVKLVSSNLCRAIITCNKPMECGHVQTVVPSSWGELQTCHRAL